MDETLKQASELGKLIAKHPRYQRLREVEDTADKDADTKELLRKFEEKRQEIAELEATNAPIEAEQKHEMQDLTTRVHSSPLLQDLAKAQADYMELMNKVNGAIRRELGGGNPDPAE